MDTSAQWRPVVVVDQEAGVEWVTADTFRLVLRNVGRGPALEVAVELFAASDCVDMDAFETDVTDLLLAPGDAAAVSIRPLPRFETFGLDLWIRFVDIEKTDFVISAEFVNDQEVPRLDSQYYQVLDADRSDVARRFKAATRGWRRGAGQLVAGSTSRWREP